MPSELYVQVPVEYGDFSYAGPGTPLQALIKFGRDAGVLLNLHLKMVLYSKRWRTEGRILTANVWHLAWPTPPELAEQDAKRLVEVGLLEETEYGYYVATAEEWSLRRVGSRDQIPDSRRERVFERDGYTCVECGTGDDLTIDHIIPWSQGGSDYSHNLRTLCGVCNSRKGARV